MTKKKLKNQFTRKIYLHKLFDSVHFPDVELYSVSWVENYGYMRNLCLKYVSNSWVWIVDADEQLVNEIKNQELMHF